MRRFSLIGRLGPDDKASVVPLQPDSAVYEIDFLDRVRFQAKFLVFYQMVPLDPAGRVSVSELTTSLEGAILTEGKSQAGTLLVSLCVGPSLTSAPHTKYHISTPLIPFFHLPPFLPSFCIYEHTCQS